MGRSAKAPAPTDGDRAVAAPLSCRLDRLEAIEEVRALVGRYAVGADSRNDPAVMRPLFTPHAVWEAKGFGRCEGADQIARHLARIGNEQIRWSLHCMATPWIEIEAGATAGRCRWHLWELALLRPQIALEDLAGTADVDDVAHWMGGTYDTEVEKTGDGWKFSRVLLDLRLASPYAEGWQLMGDLAR